MTALLLLSACRSCDPPPVVPGEASVKAACDTMRRFECPEASPSGMTCEDSLSKLLEVGTITTTRLACISGAKDADQMPTCHVKCGR